MPRPVRGVLLIAAGTVALIALTVGATFAAVYGGGSVAVSVEHDDASRIDVAIPAGVANVALAATSAIPAGRWAAGEIPADARRELERYLPHAQEAIDLLAAQPDFTLVEVDSPDTKVLVRKEGRELRILVDDDGTRIDVAIPLSTVRRVGKRLGRIADRL